MNGLIQQQFKATSGEDVLKMLKDIHERLVAKVTAMSEEELKQPYRNLQPDSQLENPVSRSIVINTYGHFDEHRPWIEAIAASYHK